MLDESIFRGVQLAIVGNINRDLKSSPLAPGDYLFRDGETPLAGVYETMGGGGANSAAIAARLGANISFIGQVGDDALGRQLEQALTRQGIHCHLHKAPNLATGTTLNLVFNTGQRHFLSCHPNNATLAFESLDLSALLNAQHLHRADIWFSNAMLFGGNEKLFRVARAAGVPTSIDLNWDPQWGHAGENEIQRRKEAVRAVLPLVDLAHGNGRELCTFTDAPELPEALTRLVEWGVGAVVVHLGSQGAAYFSRGEMCLEPPAAIARQLMATGTGDVLSVCLMLMHHRTDLAAPEKLRLANRIVAEFIDGRRRLIPELNS